MIARLRSFAKRWIIKLTPHPQTRAGMVSALHLSGWLLLALLYLVILLQAPSVYNALALLLAAGLLVAAVAVVYGLVTLLAKLSPRARWSSFLLLTVTIAPFAFLGPTFYALAGLFFAAVGLLGASWVNRGRVGLTWRTWLPGTVGGLSLLGLTFMLSTEGWLADEDIAWQPMRDAPLELEDPGRPGLYPVSEFTYGPGTDQRRLQYGKNVRFETAPVDGSKLLDGWEGGAGWARSAYWQIKAEQLPVRGMVWMPQGRGPFPLVLIVHGNHQMEDYSEDGYAYLGELFASRGIITVSVDENFYNSSTADLLSVFEGGLEEENDARGWMLLEHLQQWRRWNETAGHELFGKADLDRVVLIGHSRGGEAVSEAAVFNRLAAYPDDATLAFDYDFGIRGIIAIAPVDHQYDPRSRQTEMRDVSYLVMHGSHDSDVNSFAGSATYSRLQFRDCADCFKTGIYLIGANHGQFNTSWGRYDAPAPFSRFLNTHVLMDGELQRRVARTFFSAFIEAVLFDKPAYREFMAAPHRAQALFAEDVKFLSQYQAAADEVWLNFEEDADVVTATRPDARISSQGLSLWAEQEVPLKWRDTDNAMVLLGWARAEEGAPAPAYHVELAQARGFAATDLLSMSLSMSKEPPGEIDDYQPPDDIDFTLELHDRAGQIARLPLSARRVLLPQVAATLYKLPGLDTDPASEVVMQRYRFGLDEFVAANPALDLQAITALRLVFDRTAPASLWLDDLGIARDGA